MAPSTSFPEVPNLNGNTTVPLLTTNAGTLSQLFNQGQINLNGGTSTAVLQNSVSISFVNAGTINVSSGTLILGGGTHQTRTILVGQGFVDLNGVSSSNSTVLNDTLAANGTNVNLSGGTVSAWATLRSMVCLTGSANVHGFSVQ